jgi:RNA polymerase sigma-70 factor (ECF subfamily)
MTAAHLPFRLLVGDPTAGDGVAAGPEDAALVLATLRGEHDGFAELVRRYKGRVLGMCSRFARDAHQLEDLAQEVFLRAFKRLAGFRGEAPFEHWLSRLTVTACYDFLRKERRHRDAVELDAQTLELRDVSLDNAASAGRAKELLDWAMAQLTVEDRMILTLLEIEEKPVREIAGLTGLSESNVKVKAFRARARLRTILEKHHER